MAQATGSEFKPVDVEAPLNKDLRKQSIAVGDSEAAIDDDDDSIKQVHSEKIIDSGPQSATHIKIPDNSELEQD